MNPPSRRVEPVAYDELPCSRAARYLTNPTHRLTPFVPSPLVERGRRFSDRGKARRVKVEAELRGIRPGIIKINGAPAEARIARNIDLDRPIGNKVFYYVEE
jgi:hypothetical protein